jgi:hypothetical protein
MKRIYIVELRRAIQVKDSTVMYVASTLVKAMDWCKKNTDCHPHDTKNPWWFAILEEQIDCDIDEPEYLARGLVKIISWKGNEIDYQPIGGYTEGE